VHSGAVGQHLTTHSAGEGAAWGRGEGARRGRGRRGWAGTSYASAARSPPSSSRPACTNTSTGRSLSTSEGIGLGGSVAGSYGCTDVTEVRETVDGWLERPLGPPGADKGKAMLSPARRCARVCKMKER
jgi:hypothetical protein